MPFKDILKLLAQSLLIPLGLKAPLTTDGAIQKKTYSSGMTTLMISNEEMKHIIKIVKSLKESGLLIKGVNETIKNEAKKSVGFLCMLSGTLSAGF